MKKNKIDLETCEFIPATTLVPKNWDDWFWGIFSQDADFSWGDNNRTLITAERFAAHCRECDLTENASKKEVDKFMRVLIDLGETYIDLEN